MPLVMMKHCGKYWNEIQSAQFTRVMDSSSIPDRNTCHYEIDVHDTSLRLSLGHVFFKTFNHKYIW